MSQSWLSLDTCMSCLGSVLSFHVSSCLMSDDCVQIVGPFTRFTYLLTVKQLFLRSLFCGYNDMS